MSHLFTKTEPFIAGFCKLLLLCVFISLFVPFSPKMPAANIDMSWALALNQAVTQGLAFGKEIIFTLGPYSFIYTKVYHPALDNWMIGGSFYLAICYWLSLMYLMRSSHWHWGAFFAITLFLMLYARDSLLYSYPFLVGLNCCLRFGSLKSLQKIILFAPLGLLVLVKGTLLILCAAIIFLSFLFFCFRRQVKNACIAVTVPLFSMLFFWIGIGQSLHTVPSYITTTLSMASNFTQAMALDLDYMEIFLYIANSLLLLSLISLQKQVIGLQKIFLFALFLIFLFMSFKAGFARHYGHALIPATSLIIATLLLPFIFNYRWITLFILCSMGTSIFIIGHYTKISLYGNFISNYTSTWNGIKNRILHKEWLKQDFNLAMGFLHTQMPLPAFTGTTDIYSYNQAYLLASPNRWSPRPIFQSYSVFNAYQAQLNQKHLESIDQPDNLIFKVEPIDDRLPSLEDGLSWPSILVNYRPVQLEHNFLFLHKKKQMTQIKQFLKSISKQKHFLGEKVVLPPSKEPLFMEIEIFPTIFNQIATLFFKPAPLYITLNLHDGSRKQYRLIANMAKSGFLISPLIENTTEFTLMYSTKNDLKEKLVDSFNIQINEAKNWQWQPEYRIHLKKINHSPHLI